MPNCKECDDEVDELFTMKIDGRKMKLCEDCADRAREEAEIAGEALGAMQNMMGYKGKF
jgi:ribosome-binding protein aMBF1 (putative translation factor)